MLEIPGYTEGEAAIAREHLVAKQVQNHGLAPDQLVITDQAISAIVRFTREAGVRNLEREIAAVCGRRRAAAPKATANRWSLQQTS